MSETQTVIPGIGMSLQDKINHSIDILKTFEGSALERSEDGYYLAFSGGKDSCVLKQLAIMSGVKFKSWYNQTTIDPPELIRFIKQYHPDVQWNRPKRNFFKALEESHGLPTRRVRWCCAEFKEQGGDGLVTLVGVRASESNRRAKQWREYQTRHDSFVVAPILYWTDEDVWGFIREQHIPYCSLYDEGFTRLGCVGCPMAGQGRLMEFARWPGFERAWRIATKKYFDRRKGKLNRNGKEYYIERFNDSDEFFDWWLSENPTSKDDGNMCLNMSSGNEEGE